MRKKSQRQLKSEATKNIRKSIQEINACLRQDVPTSDELAAKLRVAPANTIQVGGNHYSSDIQHWDYVVANDMDYFQAQITRYITRWKKKNGLQDLEKALHYMQKYLEVVKSGKFLPADKVVSVAKKGRPKKSV